MGSVLGVHGRLSACSRTLLGFPLSEPERDARGRKPDREATRYLPVDVGSWDKGEGPASQAKEGWEGGLGTHGEL